jgi:hypothetical protein
MQDPRRVVARKLQNQVQVTFATGPCTVQTMEGTVHAKAGDAIVTGTAGEHWRVSSAHFGHKYHPVPPTEAGQNGTYRSLRYRVLAVPMTDGFEVLLSDGESRLAGRPGDWLVDYGDGSLGIVAPAVFGRTYEIIT